MKPIITIILAIAMSTAGSPAFAAWAKQSSTADQDAEYTTGAAANASLAFAAGFKSGGSSVTKLYTRTTDGDTWQPGSIDAIALSSAFQNDTTAYLGGMSGNVFRSQDGGQSWSTVSEAAISEGGIFNAIPVMDMVISQDASGIMAVGSDGTISLSTDAGSTWTVIEVPLPSEESALTCGAIIGENIWLLGGTSPDGLPSSAGFVIYSDDGGASFETISADNSHQFLDVSFVNPMEGWAAATTGEEGSAAIARTIDGGATWEFVTPADLPQSEVIGANFGALGVLAGCSRVQFFGRLVGTALCSTRTYDADNGSNGLYLTSDGGETWNAQPGYKDLYENILMAGNNIHDMAMADCHSGWLIGQAQTIARWDNDDQGMDCEAGGAPGDEIPDDLAGGSRDENCGCGTAGTTSQSLLATLLSFF